MKTAHAPTLASRLATFGLSGKEAEVYGALLAEGESSVADLQKRVSSPRTSIYPLLRSLMNHGLVVCRSSSRRKLFSVEHPERLIQFHDSRRDELRILVTDLIQAQRVTSKLKVVREYSGAEGIKAAYERVLSTVRENDFYLVISNQQTWFDIDPAFFKEFRRRRSHLRCTTRLILKDSEAARLSQSQQHLYNESIRLLKTQAPFNHGIVVVPHLAFFVQTIVPYGGVIIENRHLVDTLRGVFEILWAQLET